MSSHNRGLFFNSLGGDAAWMIESRRSRSNGRLTIAHTKWCGGCSATNRPFCFAMSHRGRETPVLDWILDTIHNFIRNGFSVASFAGAFVLFLKNRRMRRYIERRLPRALRDHSVEANEMVLRKLDAIIDHLGVRECNAPMSKPLSESIRASSSKRSTSSQPARSIARSIGRSTFWKGMRKMEKLKSRKFWVAIIGALLVVLNNELEWGFSQETIYGFVGIIMTYILGQSHVDANNAGGNISRDSEVKSDAQSYISDQPRK